MKTTGQIGKWGVGVLGAVSFVLIVNLALQFSRLHSGNAAPRTTVSPGAKAATPLGAKAATRKQEAPDELARYDPIIKLDTLKELENRPLAHLDRNPFEFAATPTPAAAIQTANAPAPQAPPPPPPVTLKALGYSEGNGGVKEAMVSDEDQVYVVHEGESIGTRYKVINITPSQITVQDATLHQTVSLPIPE